MSLNYLGMARSPPLYRQLSTQSTPTSTRVTGLSDLSSTQLDVAEDNKDVLIERLNDVIARLTNNNDLENNDVEALHAEVDRIERIELLARARDKSISPKSPRVSNEGFEAGSPMGNGGDVFWGPPTPTRSLNMRFPKETSSK